MTRLEYLPSEPADGEDLVAFLTSHVWPFHVDPRPDPASVRRRVEEGFYASDESTETYWMVEAGRRVGLVHLFDLADPTPLFDLRLAVPARGKGHGRSAVMWLTQRLFQRSPDTLRVEATTRQDNCAMRRVLRHCGYVKEAHYRQAWSGSEGRNYDAVGYAILRSDWESGRTTIPAFADELG
jgi:RimJ/RimL family protein N-acetyltransferase